MGGVYYVAEVATYYGIVGLAETESEAVRVAAVKAKEYLDNAETYDPETSLPWTVERIIAYFDPRVTVLAMGSAEYEGEGGQFDEGRG
jgi:hypothetical protein